MATLFDMRHRGKVLPVNDQAARPLWSVMIPVFNGAADLRNSLASVLAQDPGSAAMQIEVVDDCSTTDDPQAVVEEIGGGRVAFYRQPINVGHSRNFNTCLERAEGHLVHILHADDWVGDGFYTNMEKLLTAEPASGAAFCRHAVVRPDGTTDRLSPLERSTPGLIEDWLTKAAAELRLQPPSIVVRRSVYEELGGFDTRMGSCGEDWEMWVRIAARYPVAFHPEVLAYYRDSSESLTKRSIRSGQNIRDVRLATRISRAYLPAGPARQANNRAAERWASWGLHWAYLLIGKGDFGPAMVQMREALRCSRSPATLMQALRIGRFGLKLALKQRLGIRNG
jgi:GT2 family glycosyltransferase